MHLLPKDLYEKLEFDKILDLLQRECVGQLGTAAAAKLRVQDQHAIILRQLNETHEMLEAQSSTQPMPLHAYDDLRDDLRMLAIEGYVLAEEGLQRINNTLRQTVAVFQYFTPVRRQQYGTLYDLLRPVTLEAELQKAIDRVIDEEGQIRPDASPELQKIRKQIGSQQRELDRVFRTLIQEYRQRGWLTDNVESFRNGRRVLSVPAEHKRKIRGIIHDESTTGKTAFIEPERVIDINNDIFDLQTEEKREIYRILRELSATLRPYGEFLQQYQDLLIELDVIRAKARLASKMRGVLPKVKNEPNLGIQMGFHPLLYIKNKDLDRETVPFDLQLHGSNRLLMLSGPNAGGKSVTMKAVGLLQLMVQAGLLVPVDEISEFGIFKKIYADIGDQQSLEDDLSTYSSRLQNMRNFLQGSDEHTLLLIDEFGSGTDPKIGGAIAEAILQDLHRKRVYGVITTHYSNLKIYAFKTQGIVNGSMHFDKDTLSPTYELRVGRPGSSYAFEIAEKSGLPKKVLNYARHRTGKNEKAVDQLLVDLQREKQELEERLENARRQQNQLERLIKNYEQLHKDLEYRRKKLKLERKEQALQQSAQENKALERVIREIREHQKLDKAKEVAGQLRVQRNDLGREVNDLREEIYQVPQVATAKRKEGAIQVGDSVRMRSGGATGTVESINKNKATVAMGMLHVEAKLRDLVHADTPLNVQSQRSVHADVINQAAQFEDKLDIRGMRMTEAMKTVEDFMDRALMANAGTVQILHGKGNGTLRNVVRKKVREYRAVTRIAHPPAEQGGDGITVVEF